MTDRLVYWGTCDNCLTNMTISRHPEGQMLPEQDDPDEFWEDTMPSCPVCGVSYIRLENFGPAERFILD